MRKPFITEETIAEYISWRNSCRGKDVSDEPVDPLKFANYCVDKIVGDVSNMLYDQLYEKDNQIEYGIQKGCRCMSCWGWNIVDEDGNPLTSFDGFEDMIHAARQDTLP